MKKKSNYDQFKRYYDKRYASRWDSWLLRKRKPLSLDQKYHRDFIISNVSKIATTQTFQGGHLRILDIGCGMGWLTKLLSNYGEVMGVDLSVEQAKRLYPELRFTPANIITEDIKGEQFDIIVSSEVIEHLAEDDQRIFVNKVYDLLSKDGFLILTTPDKAYSEKMLRAVPSLKYQLQPIENWLDKTSLKSVLEPYFSVKCIKYIGFHSFFIRKVGIQLLLPKVNLHKASDQVKRRESLFVRKLHWIPPLVASVIFIIISDSYAPFRFIDAALGLSDQGAYVAVVAQKQCR